MNIAPAPLPTPLPGHKYLDWTTWQQSENLLDLRKAAIREGERFHLFCMHVLMFPNMINALRQRLNASAPAPVVLQADSIWIDARPQARWPGGSVELADLLVDVAVSARGTRSRRAVLLQAKYCDWDNLGPGACKPGFGDSTNNERDLLEAHQGRVELYASSTSKRGIPYDPPGNEFDVFTDSPSRRLIDHSRYLLFPRTPDPSGTPYLAISPMTRTRGDGQYHEDYEDLLYRMSLVQDTTVPGLHTGKEWSKLVDGLQQWAIDKAIDNIEVKRVGHMFPHLSSAFTTLFDPGQLMQPGSAMHLYVGPKGQTFFRSGTDDQRFWQRRTGTSGSGPNAPATYSTEEGPVRGYWQVRLRVRYP